MVASSSVLFLTVTGEITGWPLARTFTEQSPDQRLYNSASTIMGRLFLAFFSILLVGASCLAQPGLLHDGGGDPSGAQPVPMKVLKSGYQSGLFDVNTRVPIAVSGVQGGLYYSGGTEGGGMTGKFQVHQQDLLSVTYAEAIQVHGLAVGVVRHFVPTVSPYGDSHTDIRSQPTAWPLVLDWHMENPTLTISPQPADWAPLAPPNGPEIRGHFASLHNAGDIEAALEYQGYGRVQPRPDLLVLDTKAVTLASISGFWSSSDIESPDPIFNISPGCVEVLYPDGILERIDVQTGGAIQLLGSSIYIYSSRNASRQYNPNIQAPIESGLTTGPCGDRDPPAAVYSGTWGAAYTGGCWTVQTVLNITTYTCSSTGGTTCRLDVRTAGDLVTHQEECGSGIKIIHDSTARTLTVCN